ncbi:hypothetical protein H0H93_015401 [Arthromyces matolae]|nr:hypothetical protein H0H93_015401 [Arthromyces matolae]
MKHKRKTLKGPAAKHVVRESSLSTHLTFVRRLFLGLTAFIAIYCSLVLFVLTPWAQTQVVYAHRFDVAGSTSSGFRHPENYGIAPGKAINLRLRAPDGTSLGAWFILSEPVYRSLQAPFEQRSSDEDILLIRQALSSSPTLLFLHGNTGTRATPPRTAMYTSLTSRLSVNILALDYRGYGDSEGEPSVPGVAMDARTAWDWLTVEMGADVNDIIIVGHSLGTAIAGLLGAQLGKEGVNVRGIALLAPFTSTRLLMAQFAVMGIPLLKPIAKLPLVPELLKSVVAHNFDTLSQAADITAPIFIAHALDDADIPYEHAAVLFNALVEPYLPPSIELESPTRLPTSHSLNNSLTPIISNTRHLDWDTITTAQASKAAHREKIITKKDIPHFGVIQEFKASRDKLQIESSETLRAPNHVRDRRIMFLKTIYGGHPVGRLEGVQDALGKMFGLIP